MGDVLPCSVYIRLSLSPVGLEWPLEDRIFQGKQGRIAWDISTTARTNRTHERHSRMKLTTGLTTASLAGLALAESTIIQTFRAGPSNINLPDLVASVVDANAIATTYHMQCAPSVSRDPFCPLPSPVTLIEDPSTANVHFLYDTSSSSGGHATDAQVTMSQDCTITPSVTASCTVSFDATVTAEGLTTSTAANTDIGVAPSDMFFSPLTVTAGVKKLRSPQATEMPDAAAENGKTAGMGAVAAAGVAAAAILL